LYFLYSNIVLSVLFSPAPHSLWARSSDFATVPTLPSLAEVGKALPAEASLCVQNNLGPHFSHRQRIQMFGRCGPDDYLMIHPRDIPMPETMLTAKLFNFLYGLEFVRYAELVRSIGSSGKWRLEAEKDGYYLFRSDPTAGVDPALVDRLNHELDNLAAAQFRHRRRGPAWTGLLIE
jgi:hypothetical protein